MTFDYYLIMIPAFLFSMIAQIYVNSTYRKYSQVRNYLGLTGEDAAYQLIRATGLDHVRLQGTSGTLSDHYDPRNKILKLSPAVAQQPSIASIAVAAHELGHAQQDHQNYFPLKLRSAIVPMANIGSSLGWIMILVGLMLNFANLAQIGVIFFSAGALFALVTLPVELDASKRARAMLKSNGLVVNAQEEEGVRKVLNAAALTYIAALATSLMQLFYFTSLTRRMRR